MAWSRGTRQTRATDGRAVAYLLHFSRKVADHAGHYLGSADDLDRRLAEHQRGTGARLTQVAVELGIELTLVRTWPGGSQQERRLKRQKHGPRLCPLCSPRKPTRKRSSTGTPTTKSPNQLRGAPQWPA